MLKGVEVSSRRRGWLKRSFIQRKQSRDIRSASDTVKNTEQSSQEEEQKKPKGGEKIKQRPSRPRASKDGNIWGGRGTEARMTTDSAHSSCVSSVGSSKGRQRRWPGVTRLLAQSKHKHAHLLQTQMSSR